MCIVLYVYSQTPGRAATPAARSRAVWPSQRTPHTGADTTLRTDARTAPPADPPATTPASTAAGPSWGKHGTRPAIWIPGGTHTATRGCSVSGRQHGLDRSSATSPRLWLAGCSPAASAAAAAAAATVCCAGSATRPLFRGIPGSSHPHTTPTTAPAVRSRKCANAAAATAAAAVRPWPRQHASSTTTFTAAAPDAAATGNERPHASTLFQAHGQHTACRAHKPAAARAAYQCPAISAATTVATAAAATTAAAAAAAATRADADSDIRPAVAPAAAAAAAWQYAELARR